MASFWAGIPQICMTLFTIAHACYHHVNHTTPENKADNRIDKACTRIEKHLTKLANEREEKEAERFNVQQEIDEERHNEMLAALAGKPKKVPRTGAQRMADMRARNKAEPSSSAPTGPGLTPPQASPSAPQGRPTPTWPAGSPTQAPQAPASRPRRVSPPPTGGSTATSSTPTSTNTPSTDGTGSRKNS